MSVNELKANHKLLTSFSYPLGTIERGYNKRRLHIDLSAMKIETHTIPQDMIDKFVGGKGFDLRILWDCVNERTKWDSPENAICIASGPLGGNTSYPGSGKSIVTTISPMTGIPIDSNVGGHFGPYLKFSGFDAMSIQGKAQNDCIVYINGNTGIIEIFEAPDEAIDAHILSEQLHEMFAENEDELQNISVVSAGSAAKFANMGILNFSFYDPKRKLVRLKQAGRGGIGKVFRNKNIKALVVKYTGLRVDLNNPADIKTLKETGLKLHRQIHKLDSSQFTMRQVGTANIVTVMNDYDLLPTKNFKYGSDERAPQVGKPKLKELFTQNISDACWYGCSLNCAKGVDNFIPRTGPYKGQPVIVDGPEYETVGACASNLFIWDAHDCIEQNFYCDTYGVDTISFGTTMAFVMECYEYGILTKEMTGGLDFTWGNADAVLEVLHQMSRGEGFGYKVGLGTRWLKNWLINDHNADATLLKDIAMEVKGLEYSEYVSKESLAQQGGYTLALKGPQHDEAWLIFMDMVNNSMPTFEQKAEALHYFPMFRTWFGLLGLCKLCWNDTIPESNATAAEPAKVPEHVENYHKIYTAITGKPMNNEEMILQSERVYTFQKIFNLRMGGGKREDDMPPFRAVGPVTEEEYLSRAERYEKELREKAEIDPTNMSTKEKMKALRDYRMSRYMTLVDTVYKRKGWDLNGVPTDEHLKRIGMDLPELMEVCRMFRQ